MQNRGIVFMGTPEFAVASLKAITDAGFDVKAVVTAPDKPSGRGLQLHSSPVKEFALEKGLPVLQPVKLKDPEFLQALKNFKPALQVVVAFRMLPEEVWSLPPLGTFNLHASLLPQYRGAAPINHAVMNGETKTGVTTFFINHEIDKGALISSSETPIGENESAGEVHDRLMEIGSDLVVETIRNIFSGKIKPVDQILVKTEVPLKAAPKIFREECRINWNQGIDTIHNFIRGLSPHPAAWTDLLTPTGEKLNFKIFRAVRLRDSHSLRPGELVTDKKTFVKVAARDGFMQLYRVQLQGKKQLDIEDFLRGFDLNNCRLT